MLFARDSNFCYLGFCQLPNPDIEWPFIFQQNLFKEKYSHIYALCKNRQFFIWKQNLQLCSSKRKKIVQEVYCTVAELFYCKKIDRPRFWEIFRAEEENNVNVTCAFVYSAICFLVLCDTKYPFANLRKYNALCNGVDN